MFHEDKNLILEASGHNLLWKILIHHVKFPPYLSYSYLEPLNFGSVY